MLCWQFCDSEISLYQYILGSWEEMNSNIPLTVTERWDDVRLSADKTMRFQLIIRMMLAPYIFSI